MLGTELAGGPAIVDAIIDERSSVLGELTDTDGDAGLRSPPKREPRWLQTHTRHLAVSDALAAAVATLVARFWAFGWGPADLEVRSLQIPYTAAVVVTVPAWLIVLALSRCYDTGPFGSVTKGTRRIVSAGAHFLAVIAVAYYVASLERLGRDFLIAIVPLAVILTLLGRAVASLRLQQQRARGRFKRRALVMGSRQNVGTIFDQLARHPRSGIVGVAALTPDGRRTELGESGIPVVGAPADLGRILPGTDADLLVVAGGLAPGELRKLTWNLEGTGIEVMFAPAAAHLAGPQFDIRPVAGLPLLYVDHAVLNTP